MVNKSLSEILANFWRKQLNSYSRTYDMKYTILYIIVFLVSLSSVAQNSWVLKKDRNDIEIYKRDYPDSKFKEYKAIMTVKTSLKKVKEIILDGEHLKDWNHKTSKSRLVKKDDDNNYIFYLYNDMPWPVINRDHVSNIVVTYPTNKSVLIAITPNNNVLPETEGVVRITNFKGFWLLEETDEGIIITNQLFGDPEGGVPSWLVNSQLVKFPYITFKNLKKLLINKK